MSSWKETSSDDNAIAIEIADAIDREGSERLEMKNFLGNINTVEREKDTIFVDQEGNLHNSMTPLRWMFAGVLGMVSLGLTRIIMEVAEYFSMKLTFGSIAITAIGLFFAMLGIHFLRTRGRTKIEEPIVRSSFTLRLDASGFGINGKTKASLETIQAFEAARKGVELVGKDRKRVLLAFELEDHAQHGEIAARLNDGLVELRSRGGYRGAAPKVRIAADDEELDESDPNESEERKRMRR